MTTIKTLRSTSQRPVPFSPYFDIGIFLGLRTHLLHLRLGLSTINRTWTSRVETSFLVICVRTRQYHLRPHVRRVTVTCFVCMCLSFTHSISLFLCLLYAFSPLPELARSTLVAPTGGLRRPVKSPCNQGTDQCVGSHDAVRCVTNRDMHGDNFGFHASLPLRTWRYV